MNMSDKKTVVVTERPGQNLQPFLTFEPKNFDSFAVYNKLKITQQLVLFF